MKAVTPHEMCTALKTKCLVSKNHQDFSNMGKQWNDFKVKETRTEQDKIFTTLDEH